VTSPLVPPPPFSNDCLGAAVVGVVPRVGAAVVCVPSPPPPWVVLVVVVVVVALVVELDVVVGSLVVVCEMGII
jgi:hypothetical protein